MAAIRIKERHLKYFTKVPTLKEFTVYTVKILLLRTKF